MREIHEFIDSCNRNHIRKKKEEIQNIFLLADQIGDVISCVLSPKPKAPLQPWDRFPDLFKKEQELFEETMAKRRMEEYKMERIAMANAHNEQIRKEVRE